MKPFAFIVTLLGFNGYGSSYRYEDRNHPDCLTRHAQFYSYCPQYRKAPFPDDSLHWCTEKALYKTIYTNGDLSPYLSSPDEVQKISIDLSNKHRNLVLARREHVKALLMNDPTTRELDRKIGNTRINMGEQVSTQFMPQFVEDVKTRIDNAMGKCGVSDE